jgi:hypothetical protein
MSCLRAARAIHARRLRARPRAEEVPRAVVVKYPQFTAARQCDEIRISIAVDIAGRDPDDVPSTAQLDRPMPRQGHLNTAATYHADVKRTVSVEIDSDPRGSARASPGHSQVRHRCVGGPPIRRPLRHSARREEDERADKPEASGHRGTARL